MTDDLLTLKHFFDEARDGRLVALRCGECGDLAIPPKEFCPSCQKRAWSTVPLRGDGAVASFTVVRVAPRGHAGDVPYAVAVVRLSEGVSLLGRVIGIPLESLRVGLPVKFSPIVTAEHTLIGFLPA